MNNGFDQQNPQPSQSSTQGLSLQDDTSVVSSLNQPAIPNEKSNQIVAQQIHRRPPLLRIVGLTLLILSLAGSAFLILNNISSNKATPETAGASSRIKSQTIALTALSKELKTSAQAANTLTVNGKVTVSNSLVLQPTTQPANPATGQIYFDQANNNLAFYNGTQFINLLGSTVNTQVINTQTINTSNVTINNQASGSAAVTGTPGSLAMFTSGTQLGDSMISQSGQSLTVGSSTTNAIQVGTGAGVQSTTLGSTAAGSATTLQAGTGNLGLLTGPASGETGALSIRTGDSGTTAAGDITIDTGHSVIDGELIEDKTFETGLEHMDPWFGDTVSQSSAQAHSGSFSLLATSTAPNWGIIEQLPGVSVTAGHQYYFSMWVRAGSVPRNITASGVWNGASGTVTLTPVVSSSSEWTEMTGLGVAPGGATSVYLRAQSVGSTGEVHYFDDMTVTDLSSSSAFAAINIGSADAKMVTIGNINQIGATTISGGSGIRLNSGAADTTIQGGVLSFTGSANSTIATTTGSLTLASAETASWGVSTAAAGVGGDLTIHAGRGGTDAVNNGGNLIIQGGAPNGAATPGSVIVRPLTDSTDTFHIQNSSSVPFFKADSSNMIISVVGTDTAYATLQITDAHVKSTQTTPPTISTPTNCGTTPTAAITAGSTDVAGSFTVTTGTGGTSSTCDVTVTFHRPYGAAPKSIVIVGKGDIGSVNRQIYVSSSNATTFSTSFAASAAGANSTAYTFNYWVVE
jgi:hypothetical protein